MKICIERRELLKGLQRVQGVVEKRNTMPILSNILLDAEKGDQTVSLFATDMEIAIQAAYPAEVIRKGKTTLSARKVYEIVKELSDGLITLHQQENQWVQIEAGKSKFKMAALSAEDFPLAPAVKEEISIRVPAKTLSELFKKTVFAVGENDSRYILNGLLINIHVQENRKVLRFVGTDGHRLAVIEREDFEHILPEGELSGEKELQAVVPKKAIFEMKKLIEEGEEEILISLAKNQILFKKGDMTLYSRLMEGNYPNYSQVIPKGNDKPVFVNKWDLERAIRRVAILSKEKTHAVHFSFEEERLVLTTQSPELGEAEDEISMVYKGDKIGTGFNARYVLDALSVIENEEVLIELKDSLSPTLFKDPGDKKYLCVIMPMRV
ncbi:MAG: DNA polymerase III subunit beta [Nitrospiria bacterium]